MVPMIRMAIGMDKRTADSSGSGTLPAVKRAAFEIILAMSLI